MERYRRWNFLIWYFCPLKRHPNLLYTIKLIFFTINKADISTVKQATDMKLQQFKSQTDKTYLLFWDELLGGGHVTLLINQPTTYVTITTAYTYQV